LQKCFDPRDENSRPNSYQQAILDDIGIVEHRYGLGGNQSGKSQLAGREVSWVAQENHPTWTRPARWVGPLQILVLSRTSTIVEEEIWGKKLKPFLPSGTYKEVRSGGALQKVVMDNGNTILFFSHHSPDEAREKVQSFTAHYVWLDEMPNSIKLLEELHRRVQANEGYFLATFTPKVTNKDIRKLVDTPSSVHKKYTIPMLANPIYAGRENKILEQMQTYSEAYKNTLLFGDWFSGDESVYDLHPEYIEVPANYNQGWRHIEFIDPAASGKAGFGLLAECPQTNIWYLVLAEYILGSAPSDLLDAVEKKTANYNICKRVSDPHEAWFIKEAAKRGRHYIGVFKKNERKKELIKNLQESWNQRRSRIAPWCELAIDEINTCQWHETIDGKIIGASRFHILDGYQYAVDNLPKPIERTAAVGWEAQIRQASKQQKIDEKIKLQKARMGKRGRIWARNGVKVKM
jgi:phage terminase large subunit-like protein